MRILYLPNSYSQQRQREKKANIYPVRMAMEAEWYRKQGHDVWWGTNYFIKDWIFDKVIEEPENLPFLSLPYPDRVFTWAKSFTSGNYKYLPGTHIMSASGCWWGKCKFCVESREVYSWNIVDTKNNVTAYPTFYDHKPYEIRTVEDVISEIEECKALGFKEVFDDSATFPTGRWLDEFISNFSRVNSGIRFSCNMRITSNIDYVALRSANFRMLLFGIESANQKTLDKINKGVKVEDIIPCIKKAAQAGLEPHICVIFGHPNETDKDAINTLKLVHYLLRKGYAKTAQASFYQVAGETGKESHRKYIPQIYNAAYHFDFWFNQLQTIRNLDDLKYLWLKIKKGIQR